MAKVAAEGGSTANRYQILAKLAVGGMAEIFLARGASVAGVERYCVLKRILRDRAGDAQFVQMFVDEARLAAQLQHPNIASVYDIGMLGDSYFFTMEYVHGETVRSLLERAQELRRPVPLACVLTIVAGAASGLHHAHERNSNDGRPLGIVHRDVSPSNLMVSFEGNVKLVDFGVAKADDREVETKSGTVKGKISYLSPEQCRGERVDRRSDLFSLGIVMWELLTGTRLYRRESDFANMTAIVNEPPPPPSNRRPEVPRAIDEIVLRLLAKSVTDRFQTADEVVEAVENASMRAGTILSTSAVSRLVRDLFGVRPDPWLEFEGETTNYEPVAVASRPLPEELEPAAFDEVELELANVLDLSSSSMVLDPDDLLEPSELAVEPPMARPSRAVVPVAAPSPASAPAAVRAAPSAPIAAPATQSARHPRVLSPTAPPSGVPVAVPATPSAPVSVGPPPARPSRVAVSIAAPSLASAPIAPASPWNSIQLDLASPNQSNTTLRDVAPPSPPNATLLDAAPPSPPNATLRDVAPPSPPNATLRDIAPSGPPNTTLLDPAPPSPPNATLLDPAPSGPPNATLLDPAPSGPPNATLLDLAPPNSPSATLLGISAPPSSTPASPLNAYPSPVWLPAQMPSPMRVADPSASNPAIPKLPASSSEPTPVSGSAPRPVQYLAAHPDSSQARPPAHASSLPESRSAWPLVAVIVVAATIGVVAVWLWMRTHGPAPEHANIAAEPQLLPVADAEIVDTSNVPASVPPATESRDAGDGPDDAAAEIVFSPEDDAAPAAPKTPADAPAVASDARLAAPSAPPMHAPGNPSQRPHVPTGAGVPRTTSSRAASGSRPAPSDGSLPEPTPAHAPPADVPSPAPGRNASPSSRPTAPTFESLHALYQNNDYTSVVRACSETTVTVAIANVCTLAACHIHDTTLAQHWLRINPAALRDELIAYCKQLGTAI